jgi:hypothetical protein
MLWPIGAGYATGSWDGEIEGGDRQQIEKQILI